MKLMRPVLFLFGVLLFAGRPVAAQLTIKVSGSPGMMTVTTVPAAGAQPTTVVNAATTYRVRALSSPPQKITAQLDAPMPAGVTLSATFNPVGGGTSSGAVNLDATARNVVTNIGFTNNTNATVTYRLTATAAAGVIPVQSRIVTLTLSNYP
jgi:hypothetical protein